MIEFLSAQFTENKNQNLLAMPDDVQELRTKWQSLVDEIPELTNELENEFRFGRSVTFFGGSYHIGGNIKGGSSAMWYRCSKREYEIYQKWKLVHGIPENKEKKFYKALAKLLSQNGIEFLTEDEYFRAEENPKYDPKLGYIYKITYSILEKLPKSHLKREEFLALQLGGWGPDSAKCSAYKDGKVMMYDFAIGGAKRTYIGLLLHEVGHVQEIAFSDEERKKLEQHYKIIAKEKAVIGTEFLLNPESRILYQLRFFNEFLAETYLIYCSQGKKLRKFINSLKEPLQDAWREIYEIFKDAFDNIEYI